MSADKADFDEMERLAKRLLALCSKVRGERRVDDPRGYKVGAGLTPEQRAAVVAKVRARMQRKGVALK